MVRLNKHHLHEAQQQKLFTQLSTTLGKLSSDKTGLLLSELLGTEERIMLAKRLAALILLTENKSMYKTAKLLKLSPATTQKIKRQLEEGQYDQTISILGKNKKDYFVILETLDSILHLGGILPHYNGIDRYKHL